VCASIRINYGGVNKIMVTSPSNGTVYDVSAIIEAASTATQTYLYHYYADAATANAKVMYGYNYFVVDLTETYGAGNEPVASVIDAIPAIWSVDTYKIVTSKPCVVDLCTNDFNTNGDKVIQPIKCVEYKQDNEDWRIEMEADLSYQPYLLQDYLLIVPVKGGEQPFRIKNVSVDGKKVSLTARHIGYDLENYFNRISFGETYIDTSTNGTMILIGGFCNMSFPFTFSTDATAVGTVTFKEGSVLGGYNEIITQLGGHLVMNWWDIQIQTTIGSDKQVVIEYGKNLQGAKIAEDWNSVCTTIFPYGNNNLTIAYPFHIHASGVSYDRPYARKVVFQTDSVTELTTLANAYLEANKYPKINYTVQSDNIQDVAIGDTIQVKARQFTILTNVLGYTFNVLTQRIEKVEFGNFRKDARSVFSNIQGQISEVEKKLVQETITMRNSIPVETTGTGYRFLKFFDGTLILYGTEILAATIQTAWGGMYTTASYLTITYPTDIAFTGIDYADIRAFPSTSPTAISRGLAYSTTQVSFYLDRATQQGAANYQIGYHIVGKWK
jgi:phage minor structural protein